MPLPTFTIATSAAHLSTEPSSYVRTSNAYGHRHDRVLEDHLYDWDREDLEALARGFDGEVLTFVVTRNDSGEAKTFTVRAALSVTVAEVVVPTYLFAVILRDTDLQAYTATVTASSAREAKRAAASLPGCGIDWDRDVCWATAVNLDTGDVDADEATSLDATPTEDS